MIKQNFEKNLEHQSVAVKSTIGIFEGLEVINNSGTEKNFINPELNINSPIYCSNIRKIQEENGINEGIIKESNIIDIMMETGTGKTYTYTKTIFELNKYYGIFKFIVVVPTLSIKAGTINFLNSTSSREHFKEQYGKTLKLHIVQSKKSGKNKKPNIPIAISSFVNSGAFEKNYIQVLLINTGMINSKTMETKFDKNFYDKYNIPYDALSATKSFMVIDEPHKFQKANKTWKNIQKINPQFILRYGATFPEKELKKKDILGRIEIVKVKDYHNLVYMLTAVESFNRNLVKGVIGHITEFESGKNILLKFVNSDGKEASFDLIDETERKKTFKLIAKDSLGKMHNQLIDLFVEKLNKTELILSNGLFLKKGDKINPYAYNQTLQETMIKKAIKWHFRLEKDFLTRDIKIKPLTLFFIDNIDGYRSMDGYIKKILEKCISAEAKELLKTEKSKFYKEYLEETLKDIGKTHGGYFSKDNSEKDEAIEKEVNEILHDKQAMLDLQNTRRFIFSKWTLREGWDNPNVFGICKLRSSGSEISKLQEVGRGLRLPVNEYGNRVKDMQFYLNYFVDFTENNFVDNLVDEINEKSGAISVEDIDEKLNANLIEKICEKYQITEEALLEKLDKDGVIRRDNNFEDGGADYVKRNYPLIFDGLGNNKIKKAGKVTSKIQIRTKKYEELKLLWEKINEKVILEYKIESEEKFKELFIGFLERIVNFSESGIKEKVIKIDFENNLAKLQEEQSILDNEMTKLSTMKYNEFLWQLSQELNINLKTIHNSFIESKIEINKFLNNSTIRLFKQGFNNYLMYKAFSAFEIEYKKVTSSIHPTKITDADGEVKREINRADVGVNFYDGRVGDNYLFNELFADSDLEAENIKENIKEVTVFTKIPKNSIKIPVAGGRSYSPDFAYVLNYSGKDGKEKKKLYFIVETKNIDEQGLKTEEEQKIKHADSFFGNTVKVKFKTQFKCEKIIDLINKIIS